MFSLPSLYPQHHSRDKIFQALFRFLMSRGSKVARIINDHSGEGLGTRLRICGDIRVKVNPISKLNRHPADLFTKLSKGKFFSKLDLSTHINSYPWTRSQGVMLLLTCIRDCFNILSHLAFCQHLQYSKELLKVCCRELMEL